jgi:hypothetical protein
MVLEAEDQTTASGEGFVLLQLIEERGRKDGHMKRDKTQECLHFIATHSCSY